MAKAAKHSAAAQPPKFKVGDEVIRTDRPFELCEIITQLPVTDAGEHQYRIGPPPIRGRDGTLIKDLAQAEQSNVGENELMKLEEVQNELLKQLDDAKAKKGREATRNGLLAALSDARNDYDQLIKKLPPAKLVKDFEESIATTIESFAKLTKYRIPKEITDHVCKIGAGVVDVLPLPFEAPKLEEVQNEPLKQLVFLQNELLKQVVFQRGAPFEGTARVRMQNLLSDWHAL
jgi:hypothetical protein